MSDNERAAALKTTTSALRRVTIHFQDDEVRRQSEASALQLLSAAARDTQASEKSVEIAKRALKYRKILDRLAGVDVTSPDFDASKFLGVEWCKIENLQEFCAVRGDARTSDDTARNSQE